MNDGEQGRDVALEDQVVEEPLRAIGERADEGISAAQVVAPDRERRHHPDREHVVELERPRSQPLDEQRGVLEAGGLPAEPGLEGYRGDQAEVWRGDVPRAPPTARRPLPALPWK